MSTYFYRVPNREILNGAPDAKYICTCYLIGENRGLNGRGMITVDYLAENCGYKSRSGLDCCKVNSSVRSGAG